MMIRFRQLQALRFVVSSQSITGAASLLGITQPAMSRLIAQLEDEVGSRLLERERGRMMLTAEGARFYREAEKVLDAMHQLGGAVEELRDNPRGRIRVVTMPGMMNQLIGSAVRQFTVDHPHVRISIDVQNRWRLERTFETQQFDIGLAALPIKLSGAISVTSLTTLPSLCVIPADHHLASRAIIAADDLRDVSFISFRRGSLLRERLDELFAGLGVKRKMLFEASNPEIVREMVSAGLGVSITHPLSVGPPDPGLLFRPFRPAVPVEYAILRPGAAPVQRHTETFVKMIAAAAAQLGRRRGTDPSGHMP